MKKPFLSNRRQFLTGAGGFFLAIPSLPSLLCSSTQASNVKVSRFISILRRDGVPMKFFPSIPFNSLNKIGASTREYDLKNIVGDISPCFDSRFNALKEYMIILKSINGMEIASDHSSSAILTATCFNNMSKKPERVPPGGLYSSIDHYIMEKLYQNEPFQRQMNIQISWAKSRRSYSIKANDNGGYNTMSAFNDPKLIFDSYFNQGKVEEVDSSNGDEKLVIDKVYEHLKSVRSSNKISLEDKIRLEKFSNEVFEVQKSFSSSNKAACLIPQDITGQSVDLITKIEQTFKIMSLALRCDLTRQINFDFNPDTLIKPYFNGQFHHGMSHQNSSAGVKTFEKMHKWHNDFIGDFVNSLKNDLDPLNGGDSMLDNTLIFLSNEIGNQGNGGQTGNDSNHLRVDVPCILFGNVNNYFKTGRYLDYQNSNKPANNRWYKPLGHAYNQVLTTIMSAFGVKYTEWENSGYVGFGDYRGQLYNKSKPSLMTLGNKRDPLPFIKA